MHVEILVEEESAEKSLEILLPRIVGSEVSHRIHAFNGKPDLLRKLPQRLAGYARFLPDDHRIVILVDRDQQECEQLKADLESIAHACGLRTKMSHGAARCQVLNRIAVEELEAWFLGDVEALRAEFPRLSPYLATQSKYRDPDAIRGGTFETLERLLQSKGYYPEGVPKIRLARRVASHMDPARNRSHSFIVFRDGLRGLVA